MQLYKINPNIKTKKIGDELIVLNEDNDEFLGIKGCGLFIIEFLQENEDSSLDCITKKIEEKYIINDNKIILESLTILLKQGIIYEL